MRPTLLFYPDLGADYMESFSLGGVSAGRPKDKILLKHSKRLHDRNFSPC